MELVFNLVGSFYKKSSDQTLMTKVRDDDRRAFEILYDRHKGKILSYLYYQSKDLNVAEELAQETFLRVFRYRKQFDENKNFKSWMYTIARNLMMDYFRKKKELLVEEGEIENTLSDEGLGDSEIILIGKSEEEMLKGALAKLPSSQKEALTLWMDDLSYEEMAKITGKSLQAMKNLVHRARKGLIDLLSEEAR